MSKIVGGAQGKDAKTTLFRQTNCIGCAEYLIDRAVATARNNAVDFVSTRLGNCFFRHARGIPRFPRDAHLHGVTVLPELVNSRSYPSVASRFAVQNNANSRHRF